MSRSLVRLEAGGSTGTMNVFFSDLEKILKLTYRADLSIRDGEEGVSVVMFSFSTNKLYQNQILEKIADIRETHPFTYLNIVKVR
jgi:hypothetical protein